MIMAVREGFSDHTVEIAAAWRGFPAQAGMTPTQEVLGGESFFQKRSPKTL